MSETLRRIEIPIAITIICTLLQIIPFYIEVKPLETFSDTFRSWMILVATCALFLGAASLTVLHSKKIQRRSRGWQYSILTLVSLVVIMLAGLPIPEIGLGVDNSVFDFLFANILTPLGATMYSIIAFFITSAAYRSFRARSNEATVVLVSGLLMICYNAPLMTSTWPGFTPIGDWIFSVPNMATMRAVIIGAALGAIALAMRVLLGIERGYLRGGEE
jgi:cytochrome bd-type quinol oxidase subunit 2